MRPEDLQRDPKLRACHELLTETLDAWVEHCREIGLDRAHCIGLVGEQLSLRLGFHIASERFGGDEHVEPVDMQAAYSVVAHEIAIASRLCMLNSGERPIERVRDAIRKATEGHEPSTYGKGATWALDTFEKLTLEMLDDATAV